MKALRQWDNHRVAAGMIHRANMVVQRPVGPSANKASIAKLASTKFTGLEYADCNQSNERERKQAEQLQSQFFCHQNVLPGFLRRWSGTTSRVGRWLPARIAEGSNR
jgi:hypothetical protein